MKMAKFTPLVVVLALGLSACASGNTALHNPQPRVADSVSQDCTFQNSTYGGENVRCRGEATLSGADARRAVEESRQANSHQGLFGGLVNVQVTSGYPHVYTRGRYDRRLYPEIPGDYYYRRQQTDIHYSTGGQIGTRR